MVRSFAPLMLAVLIGIAVYHDGWLVVVGKAIGILVVTTILLGFIVSAASWFGDLEL